MDKKLLGLMLSGNKKIEQELAQVKKLIDEDNNNPTLGGTFVVKLTPNEDGTTTASSYASEIYEAYNKGLLPLAVAESDGEVHAYILNSVSNKLARFINIIMAGDVSSADLMFTGISIGTDSVATFIRNMIILK